MLPACNGAMMRNIYQATSAAQANSRNYQYTGTGTINSMSAAAAASRYQPMPPYQPMSGQPFGMGPHTGPGAMAGMGRQDADSEADWYNKGFSALRMNSTPHNHANLSAPMLQYQT